MHCTVKMTEDLYWVGASDRRLALFESVYPIPRGVSYNAYVLLDEKTVLLDTVDQSVAGQFFENLAHVLGGRPLDYIVVHHMEPDHAKTLEETVRRYPEAKIICNAKIRDMIRNYFTFDIDARAILVAEGDTYCFGKHTFAYVMAPMVHWPEVMMTYDAKDKVFFSADAFGKFGALDADEDWACEARRYYFGIVGKYGGAVQTLLKKAAGLDIAVICPLHGPVLSENLGYYLNLYDIWSSYGVESEGVCIAYTSVYGNTKKAVEYLAEQLRANGCAKVAVNDLARCDMAEAVEDAFRYGKLVLATTTYNGSIFPFMRDFIDHLTERGYQKRTVAFIENGSWAPTAARNMAKMFENSKDIEQVGTVTIRSAMTDENKAQLNALAKELA